MKNRMRKEILFSLKTLMKKASDSQETNKKENTHTHTYTNKDQELLHQKLDWTPQISDCGWVESVFV
jgi:hypothetical protein